MRIHFTDHERKLAHSALTFLIETLTVKIDTHGNVTKWARDWTNAELIALRSKFGLDPVNQ